MIPTRLLRPLTLQTPTMVTDDYGAQVPSGWTDSTIMGRIDQTGERRQDTEAGRQASLTTWDLLTNTEVPDACRVVDGGVTYEVIARSWPVYAGAAVHHYEATLRLVEG